MVFRWLQRLRAGWIQASQLRTLVAPRERRSGEPLSVAMPAVVQRLEDRMLLSASPIVTDLLAAGDPLLIGEQLVARSR
jgi:hypothetical protein